MKTTAGEDIDLNFNKGSARWWMDRYANGCGYREIGIVTMRNKQTNKFVYFNDPLFYTDSSCIQGQ